MRCEISLQSLRRVGADDAEPHRRRENAAAGDLEKKRRAPQNPLYTDRELEESLGASQPETVVTLTPFYERVKRCQRATGVKRSSQ